jgi:hypothetical protein
MTRNNTKRSRLALICGLFVVAASFSCASEAWAQREQRDRGGNDRQEGSQPRGNNWQGPGRGQGPPQRYPFPVNGRGGQYGMQRGGLPPPSAGSSNRSSASTSTSQPSERDLERQRERQREQERDRMRDADRDYQRFYEAQMLLDRIDTNRNGLLDPGEGDNRTRRQIEQAAVRGNLDLDRPVRLDRLAVAMANINPANLPPGALRSMVPGFEAERKVLLPPNFDIPVEDIVSANSGGWPSRPPTLNIVEAPPSRNDRDRRNEDERRRNEDEGSNRDNNEERDEEDAERERRERIRRVAEFFMRQNDADRSGELERRYGEWSNLQAHFADADEDGDDKITRDELTAYMEKTTSEGREAAPRGEDEGADSISEKPRAAERGENLRLLLPNWFFDLDEDDDGQVSMAEFETNWTDEKIRLYLHYDRNDDGVITPAECVDADDLRRLAREQPRRGEAEDAPKGESQDQRDGDQERRKGER